tara:strand:- start:316 stop:747 length:432 start_codon:yes stop_codon:yes gene_type:complete
MVLSKILSGGLVESVGKIVDDLHVSEEEKQQAKAKLVELENQVKLKQMDINLADAQSKAGGISGMLQRSWRPLIGMSCALAIFWEFVLSKFILFICGLFQYEVVNIPELEMGTLMPLVMALLGMSGIRSFEKLKKINSDKGKE